MMRIAFLLMSVWTILFALSAEASRPVEVTLTGCVVHSTFYSIREDHAYQIQMSPSPNFVPLEGKKVSMRGWLSPGDRFVPKEGTSPEVINNVCDARSLKAVNTVYIIKYRVDALKAAKGSNFKDSSILIDKAMELDRTNCDTYIDRAQINAMLEDFTAVSRDIAVVKTGNCSHPEKANYLLLQDLAKLLENKDKKQEALEVYQLALYACTSSMSGLCKESIEKDIQRLQR